MHLPKRLKRKEGFSLIELIVVVLMIAVLASILLVVVDPFNQMKKSRDNARRHDIEEIRNALDMYYNDTGCYPTSVEEIPFGQEWRLVDQILMRKVPQEKKPICDANGCYYYNYVAAPNSCPQWNILFARLEGKVAEEEKCHNIIRNNVCEDASPRPPVNIKYTYCVFSGGLACSEITTPSFYNPSGPTPLPTPTVTPTPTIDVYPTPEPETEYFACTPDCNHIGDPQSVCSQFGAGQGRVFCYENDGSCGPGCD